MTTIQVKSELHQLIDNIDDIGLLNAVKTLLQRQVKPKEYDFWDMLPSQVQDSINKGIEEADHGNTESHEVVMGEVKKKYTL